MNQLAQRAVLMRFSAGLPGQHRKDKKTTAEVKDSKGLGNNSGSWITDLWPEGAMDGIKKKQGEARRYHDSVTFPFGCRNDDDESTPAIGGMGLLPAVLLPEYGAKVRQFRGEMEKLVADFLQDPGQWVDWARKEHNGTFNPANYPGCDTDGNGGVTFDDAKFRAVMGKKFYLRTEPLPVPDKEQFTDTVSQLLGSDADSVDLRIRDASAEASRELMRRMTQPVMHMAHRLSGSPCPCRECKGEKSKSGAFKDTLVTNIGDIVKLGPSMNIMGDPEIDTFLADMEKLTKYVPETLRKDDSVRSQAAAAAMATLERLSGYKL